MSGFVVHEAGAPVDLVQTCSRCGEVLVDYRHAAGLHPWDPKWFGVGAVVEVYRGRTWRRYTELADERPTCVPVGSRDGATDGPPVGSDA